jgi:hypothetical protein
MIEYRVEPSPNGYRIVRAYILGDIADLEWANKVGQALADAEAKAGGDIVFDPAE